jgi:hypothetical protein
MKDRDLLAAMSVSFVTSGYARNRIMSESPTDAQIASKALTLALGILEAVDERAYDRPDEPGIIVVYARPNEIGADGRVKDPYDNGGWRYTSEPYTDRNKAFVFHRSDVVEIESPFSVLIRAGAKPL